MAGAKDGSVSWMRSKGPWNLPNVLSAVRVLMVPLVVAFYYSSFSSRGVMCFVIFTVAAGTDYLDGYFARRWQISTRLGAFLDPVADKLMVATTLVLCSAGHKDRSYDVAFPAAITISREIAVSALREWMAQIGARDSVQVGWMGKCKAFAQMMALSGLLLALPTEEALPYNMSRDAIYAFSILLMWASTAMAISSANDYFRVAWPHLTK